MGLVVEPVIDDSSERLDRGGVSGLCIWAELGIERKETLRGVGVSWERVIAAGSVVRESSLLTEKRSVCIHSF